MTQEPTPQTGTDSGGLRDLIQNQPALATALGTAILIVLTFIAYIPAMRGLFIWDDDHHVVDNTLLRDWEGLGRIWTDIFTVGPANYPLPQYYPLTHTTFWLEYQLWGTDAQGRPRPMPYHVTNVVIHVCNALLIWYLLTKLNVPGAWLAAAIFALHPINAETVAWITERKNVLSFFFFLASLYVYLRYVRVIEPPAKEGEEEPTWRLPDEPNRLYILAFVLFLCALWSKTISNSMPAVALVIIWWKRGRISLKEIRDALPLLVVGAGFGALTGYMEYVRVGVGQRPQFWDFAATPMGEFGARLIIAGRALWFYVQKLIVPFPLTFNYERWTIDPSNVVMYLFPITALVALAVLVVLSRRIGRGPAAAALIFVGTLFPALGFVDVWPMQYSFVADHFAYLSSAAFIAMITGVLWKRLSLEGFAGVAVCVLLIFAGLTWGRAMVMSEMKLLWEDTIAKSKEKSWFAMNNYGVLLRDTTLIADPIQRYEIAEGWFNRSLSLNPDNAEAWMNLAIVAQRRGILLQYMQSTTQPATQFAATLPSTQPMDFFQQAVEYYRKALDVQPNFVLGHYNFANLLQLMGRRDEALEEFRKTVEHAPRHAAALRVLAQDAAEKGVWVKAAEYFGTLSDIDPDDPNLHAEYGWALLLSGRVPQGFAEWEIALGITPNDPTLANDFGVRMAAAGDMRRAFDYFRIAYQIKPDSVEVLTNIGVVAARLGRPDQARTFLTEAIKLDPNFEKAKVNLANLESGKLGPATTQATTQASTSLPSIQPGQ